MAVASAVKTEAALADRSPLAGLAVWDIERRHCGAGVALVTSAAAATEDDNGAQ